MKLFKKIVLSLLLIVSFSNLAFAQASVLPSNNTELCESILARFDSNPSSYKAESLYSQDMAGSSLYDVLACGVRTGKISLSMIPFFVSYFCNFLLGLVGIVSVLFIVIGGYMYIWGGLVDKKEAGRKYIANALTGLGLASLAWIIVNLVMVVVTS